MLGKELDANFEYVDATGRFLDLLAGVNESEKKRKIIGGAFIKVFDEEASKLEGTKFLAQGTIYPDILESDDVKAHHNVGGLCEVRIRIASNTSPFLAPDQAMSRIRMLVRTRSVKKKEDRWVR